MTRVDLAKFFRGLADSVESGDSMEGQVRYEISCRDGHDVDVDILVRTGNREGQGGYLEIREIPQSTERDAETPA